MDIKDYGCISHGPSRASFQSALDHRPRELP
jgi:hypothetical protein